MIVTAVSAASEVATSGALDGLLAPTGALATVVGLAFMVAREYRKGRAENVATAQARVKAIEQELGEVQEALSRARDTIGEQAQSYEARLQRLRDLHSQALTRAYDDVAEAHAREEEARRAYYVLREWAVQHGYTPPAASTPMGE